MFGTHDSTSFLLSVVLILAPLVRAQDGDTVFRSRDVAMGSASYHYKVYVPLNWNKNKKWPVILFLHGAGERGDDNIAQTRVGLGPAIEQRRDSFPFVVVLPQCL